MRNLYSNSSRGEDRGRSFSRGGDRDRSFSRGGDRGRSFSNDREMFSAVCSECGVDCQVPFRPSGDKPVLCSDCFRNEGGGRDRGGDRGGNRRDFDKPARRDDFKAPREDHSAKNEVFKEMNTKLDTLISILERAFPKKKVTLPKEEEMVSLPFEEEKPVKAKKAKTVKEEEEAPVKKTRAKKKV